MWFSALCLVLVFSASQGWELNKRYEYLYGSAIYQDDVPIRNVSAGLFQFQWETKNLLTGRFRPKLAGNRIDQQDSLVTPMDAFQVQFTSGQVTELKVSEDTKKWQIEFIRGMLGLLQYSDSYKSQDKFSVMEGSVAGKCLTDYVVEKNGNAMKITKSRNYSNCENVPVFERGVYGLSNYDALMKKHEIIDRDTSSRYLLKGQELYDARIQEDIRIIAGNDTIKFSSHIVLFKDDDLMRQLKESSDDEDYSVDSLISVGGMMYQPKPQRRFCSRHMGLYRNEIDSSCEVDYYMNPKEFENAYNGNEVSITKKLVEQIASELQTPSEIPKTNTLDRFTVLINLIRYMNLEQMKQVSQSGTWEPKGKESFVFQNAIVEAGTLEALEMIKSLWEREELVDDFSVVALAGKVHPLTLDYLNALFEFATKPAMMNEKNFDFIGKDLFLAFSNLVNRYTTEKEKPFKQEELNKLILVKYRKYLTGKLQMALDQKDDLKFQVYVRALGNMADLSIFSSYLSMNSEKLTPFQKTLMVNSMDKTIEAYPKKSRVLLMKLYRSSRESFSVRIAAVFQLFKTNLPDDQVIEIINIAKNSENADLQSAVKSTILSGAYKFESKQIILKEADKIELSEDSVPTGSDPEKLSQSRFRNIIDKYENLSYIVEVIRGMDSNPFSALGVGYSEKQGFKNYVKVAAMIDNFQDYIRGFTRQYPSFYDTIRSKTSSGNMEIDLDYEQIFLPFANLKSSPMDLIKLLQEDKQLKFSMLAMDELVIAFPSESGLPFMYSFQSPQLFNFKLATHVRDSFKIDIDMLYSGRGQTKMGFVNPLTAKHYVHGIDTNTQFNMPISITYKSYGSTHIVTVDPLQKEGKQRIIHLGTWPYTAVRDLFPVQPVGEDEAVKNIKPENMLRDEESFEGFSMKLASSNPSTSSIIDYFESDDLEAYDNAGPFGKLQQNHNLFNIFFENDPANPTSLIVTLDLASDKLSISSQMDGVGKLSGPFYFMGKTLFEGEVELTGQTNHSVSMKVQQQTDLISEALKVSWQGSYKENDLEAYGACLDTYVHDERPMVDNIYIFSKMRLGKSCMEGKYISAEVEINPNELEKETDMNLDITLDFDGWDEETSVQICELKGDQHPLKDETDINLNFIQKDVEKCDELLNNTENDQVVRSTTEVVDFRARDPDMDAEVMDLLAE